MCLTLIILFFVTFFYLNSNTLCSFFSSKCIVLLTLVWCHWTTCVTLDWHSTFFLGVIKFWSLKPVSRSLYNALQVAVSLLFLERTANRSRNNSRKMLATHPVSKCSLARLQFQQKVREHDLPVHRTKWLYITSSVSVVFQYLILPFVALIVHNLLVRFKLYFTGH